MKLFFYEQRKYFFRRYVIVFLLLFTILDIGRISLEIYQGNADLLQQESEDNKEAVRLLYQEVKGEITKDKEDFLAGEEARLGEIYYKKMGSSDKNEVTYSGNLYEDYRLLEVYIAEGFYYAQDYENYCRDIVNMAKENIAYYEDADNFLAAKENAYIAETYSRRRITSFYRMDMLESYLKDHFSFWLILIMCFLCIAPVFGQEYESNMCFLLQSTQGGGASTTRIKIVASLCNAIFFVLWFCGIEFLTYYLGGGLEGLAQPVWAIPSYKNSALNCQISYYIGMRVLHYVVAIAVVALVLLLLSILVKKPLYIAIAFAAVVGAWCGICNLWTGEGTIENIVSLCNPVALYQSERLFQEFQYVEVGQTFFLKSNVCLIGNTMLFVVLLIFIAKRRGMTNGKK